MCGKSYKHKASLYNHITFECGQDKNFKCPIENCAFMCYQCGKNFKFKASLKNHMEFVCQKEPTFSCPVCLRKSKLVGNLKKHIIKMHPNYDTNLLKKSVDVKLKTKDEFNNMFM
ncbi:unnamed protein product [Psylliodes chrysocephalus]|uniref:C2H2-type domain-containing protein n=1 Tax=Psylliodes chrysocephalus TaxID=3402493 RepID=A0A9P0CX54_9CUCU|nr:unnamed protein product [Psylliodes chrysocephala]